MFDELGVDHVFIDEAHYFKNLETPTKMERVAGIQTGGSERAFDLYMKARYLDEQHPGHGVTFATGTPITNTMVEMYTMQRFLDPEGLKSRGIEHFDAWAATFGEVVDTMEISPDGATLAAPQPLRQIHQPARTPADVPGLRRRADGRDARPAPARAGRRQADRRRLPDVRRAGAPSSRSWSPATSACASQKVDPREDNALAITTDGRKLALDARLLSATAAGFPRTRRSTPWSTTSPPSGGTTAADARHADDLLRHGRESDALGVLASMTRSSTSWSPAASRASRSPPSATPIPTPRNRPCSRRSGSGAVRVLIGSTQKMGTGTNVQKRLVALHHLDAPWKPAEVEQRDGRILRQGNENEEVAIYRYVTEGSFDAYMWQALETKARFIAQVMTGDNAARRAEDIGGQELSYAEVKAIASGNPAVLTLAEADAELQRLAILKKNHADEQYLARRALRDLPDTIARLTRRAGRPLRPTWRRSPPMHAIPSPSASGPAAVPMMPGHPRPPARRPAGEGPRNQALPARPLSRPGLRPGAASQRCRRGVPRRSGHPPRPCSPATITARVRCSTPSTGWPAATTANATPRARTWRSPRASSATTRPASAGPSRTTPTWPS